MLPEQRCQNPGCRAEADHLFRRLDLQRWLCLPCVARLNAIGFAWERVPAWRERAAEGRGVGKVLAA